MHYDFIAYLASKICSNGMQVLKLAKKAAKRKQIKRGVKEVIKAIRKNNKGCVNHPKFFNYTFKSLPPPRSHIFLTLISLSFCCCRICIIAGDISPIDVVTPLPVLCEDNDIPYIYVPSKDELGQAGLTKRPTSCMLILPKPLKGDMAKDADAKEYKEIYEEVFTKVKGAQIVF
jgi:H/ACA ribonucleoprotein complex subunit 2